MKAVIEKPSSTQARCCPRCQCTVLHRYGQVSGLQRYRCQTCKRTFNALTGTSRAQLRKKGKWLDSSEALVQSQTLRKAAATLLVYRNTKLRWRHLFVNSIKADRTPALQGITEADETYFLESQKGCRQLKRSPRRRGGKACKAGISNEQVCVLVARDRPGQTMEWVTKYGQMNKVQIAAFCNRCLRLMCYWSAMAIQHTVTLPRMRISRMTPST